VVKEDAGWWIGWIEEVPGVNCRERARDETLEATLAQAIDSNRVEARVCPQFRAAGVLG